MQPVFIIYSLNIGTHRSSSEGWFVPTRCIGSGRGWLGGSAIMPLQRWLCHRHHFPSHNTFCHAHYSLQHAHNEHHFARSAQPPAVQVHGDEEEDEELGSRLSGTLKDGSGCEQVVCQPRETETDRRLSGDYALAQTHTLPSKLIHGSPAGSQCAR